MYYYSFHIGDYRAATAHLTNEEDLAYRRLIDMYYDTELPIPDDFVWVARRIRSSVDVVKAVLQDMFILTDEGWDNERCAEELKGYRKMKEGGRNGAAKRWGKGGDTPPIDTPEEPQCQPVTSNHKPVTSNQVKAVRATALCPPDVDAGVWDDWKQLRKSKRATVSETVVEQARKEATKASMSLNSFLKEWCLRGSQGLKAEWLTNNQADKRTEHQKRQDATARAMLGDAYYATPTMKAIEGEVINEEPPFTRRLGR